MESIVLAKQALDELNKKDLSNMPPYFTEDEWKEYNLLILDQHNYPRMEFCEDCYFWHGVVLE